MSRNIIDYVNTSHNNGNLTSNMLTNFGKLTEKACKFSQWLTFLLKDYAFTNEYISCKWAIMPYHSCRQLLIGLVKFTINWINHSKGMRQNASSLLYKFIFFYYWSDINRMDISNRLIQNFFVNIFQIIKRNEIIAIHRFWCLRATRGVNL